MRVITIGFALAYTCLLVKCVVGCGAPDPRPIAYGVALQNCVALAQSRLQADECRHQVDVIYGQVKDAGGQ